MGGWPHSEIVAKAERVSGALFGRAKAQHSTAQHRARKSGKTRYGSHRIVCLERIISPGSGGCSCRIQLL